MACYGSFRKPERSSLSIKGSELCLLWHEGKKHSPCYATVGGVEFCVAKGYRGLDG